MAHLFGGNDQSRSPAKVAAWGPARASSAASLIAWARPALKAAGRDSATATISTSVGGSPFRARPTRPVGSPAAPSALAAAGLDRGGEGEAPDQVRCLSPLLS